MSGPQERRFTAYMGQIPCGHYPTLERAREASVGDKLVSHIVERLRAYPFTHLAKHSVAASTSPQPDGSAE